MIREASTLGIINGFKNAIGNTPLIKLESFSKESGCNILVKNEYMNPGGKRFMSIILRNPGGNIYRF